MASLSSSTTILIILIFISINLTFVLSTSSPVPKSLKTQFLTQRSLLDNTEDDQPTKTLSLSKKKPILATKNQTKLTKPKRTEAVDTVPTFPTITKTTKAKLNKTLKNIPKPFNSTKPLKFQKSNSTKQSKSLNTTTANIIKKPSKTSKFNAEITDNTVSNDIRDFQSFKFPNLKTISTSSKAYITATNLGITNNIKPIIGKTFAQKLAPVISVLTLLIPLVLLSLLFRRLRSLLSLHTILTFIQAYIAIYYATLSFTALATGLDPLHFLYAASPRAYTCAQAMQTLGYVVYLVAQLADLVQLFSTSSNGGDEGAQGLGLLQMVLGLGIGVHYYVMVFYRAVKGKEPRVDWRVHGVYAICFVVMCACSRAERRKKVYGGSEDDVCGKLS